MDGSVDNMANLEGAEAATGVGSSGCFKAAVFCQVSEDFGGKNRLVLAKAEEVVQVVDLVIIWEDVGDGGQVTVKRKAEWLANCWYAALMSVPSMVEAFQA